MKVTRYFSHADEKISKLYKSKYSEEKVRKLLSSNWRNKFYSLLEREILSLIKKLEEYNSLHPASVKFKIKAGIDTLNEKLRNDVDILITSPPYLQAQEYIRSVKLELFWLGYNEKYIKELSKKELPYNKPSKIKIFSPSYYEYREKIHEKHLLELYDAYFFSILKAFSNLGKNVKNKMCIFVGPAKIRGTPIPIDEIVKEHLCENGWKHKITMIDKIVSHSIFGVKINPASGLNENRMATEHLVVLERC